MFDGETASPVCNRVSDYAPPAHGLLGYIPTLIMPCALGKALFSRFLDAPLL